jgi:hypothetical protein
MMGSEILQNPIEERYALSKMIIESDSQNYDQRKQLQALMDRRDAVTGAINYVSANRFDGSANAKNFFKIITGMRMDWILSAKSMSRPGQLVL